jgi:CRISPR-associated exonuclease Cas4
VIALVLLLTGAVVLLYVCLGRWTRRERSAIGLNKEVVVFADDSALGTPTLRSARYGLVGRPDQLVRVGRMVIPVEHKPKARRMQQSHVLQLAAQCLLVQEVYGVRPSCGLLVLANGAQDGWSSRRHSSGAYST